MWENYLISPLDVSLVCNVLRRPISVTVIHCSDSLSPSCFLPGPNSAQWLHAEVRESHCCTPIFDSLQGYDSWGSGCEPPVLMRTHQGTNPLQTASRLSLWSQIPETKDTVCNDIMAYPWFYFQVISFCTCIQVLTKSEDAECNRYYL